MSLDPRFFLLYNVQQVINDKDSGTALVNGKLKFYQDASRSTPKDVYILSGSPPNYTYVNIGNEVTLGAAGSPMYNNNDVAIYLFAYEGEPDDQSNIIQLYYYTCESEGAVSQFTREAQPNIETGGSGGDTVNINYVPNGQFLPHLVLPADDTVDPPLEEGEIRAPITDIAWGGWTFERPEDSTAKDIVTFNPIGYVTTPPSNPPFSFNLKVDTADSGDTFKDLRIIFNDVNKFEGQIGTYSFWAKSNTGSTLPNCSIQLIKNYGSGGSPTDTIAQGSITIPVAWGQLSTEIDFGTNTGKAIGDGSYIQLALRFPINAGFNIQATNFLLAVGTEVLTAPIFPEQTNSETQYKSIAGFLPVPATDGSDLYLPLILTPTGLDYDSTSVGSISTWTYDLASLPPSYVYPQGQKFITQTQSSDGIPYSRLQVKYYNTTLNVPRYGTGPDYFTGYNISGSQLLIANNTAGAVTNAVDHGTTFTIATIHTGATTYKIKSYLISTTTFYVENVDLGAVTAPTAGNSGFTVKIVQFGVNASGSIAAPYTQATTEIFSVFVNAVPTHSHYFDWHDGTNAEWFCWFKVDGVGSIPAHSGTGIEVDLLSTDTAAIVAAKIQEALNGWQVTTVITVAGSVLPNSTYFTISSTGDDYFIWYNKSGTGVKPSVSGIGIEVDYTNSDTAATIALNTQIAINNYSYAVPDLSNAFLRSYRSGNTGAIIDYGTRYSYVPGIIGYALGTYELDIVKSHNHTYLQPDITENTGGNSGDSTPSESTADVDYTGGTENIVKNVSVNFILKY